MAFFDNLFGGGGDQGYEDAANAIKQGIGAMEGSYASGREQFQPFYDAGTAAIPQFQNLLESFSNPVSAYNNIMDQWTASPAYQFQQQQMEKAMNQAAAAGGTLGSPSQQQALASYTQGAASQDMQNFFNNVMGITSNYQSGLGNLMNQGFNAGSAINNNYMQQGNNQGMLYNAYGNAKLGQAQAEAAGDQGLFSSIFSLPSMITQGASNWGSLGNLFDGGGAPVGQGRVNPAAFAPAMANFATSLF